MLDWGSNVVNGTKVPQAPSSAFFPLVMGPTYRGPGYYPSRGSFQVPPVVPNSQISSYQSPGMTTSSGSNSGNPFHPTQGTIIFAFAALVISLLMLHFVHYGK